MMVRAMTPALMAGFLLSGCTGSVSVTTGASSPSPVVLLEEAGALAEGDAFVRGAYSDFFQIRADEGEHLRIELSSDQFDPLLEVTMVGQGTIVSDDWEGRRDLSRIDLVPSTSGDLKIRVTSFEPGVSGAYRVIVSRTSSSNSDDAPAEPDSRAMAILTPGQTVQGQVSSRDGVLDDGAHYDGLLVDVPGTRPVDLAVSVVEGPAARLIVMDPQGRYVEGEAGRVRLAEQGVHRVQIIGPAGGAGLRYRAALTYADRSAANPPPTLDRSHHRLPSLDTAEALELGLQVDGRLRRNDTALPTGELADVYAFEGQAGQRLVVDMGSSELDTYLILVGPSGRIWENDDAAGTTNARIEETLPSSGRYALVATAYRGGERGRYELRASVATGVAEGLAHSVTGQTGREAIREHAGELVAGDTQLGSGEFFDDYTFSLSAGQEVLVELSSSDFDTYLILRPPSGQQLDNDDVTQGNTNSTLTYRAEEAGPHRIVVTSYRPGETGRYNLVVRGGEGSSIDQGTVATGHPSDTTPHADERTGWRNIDGSLGRGDESLAQGRLGDTHEFVWPAGQAVHVETRSTDFDTVLVIHAPSGAQWDNDDQRPNDTNSALDLVTNEAGRYRVVVTSYRPAETGRYRLTVGTPAGTESEPTVAAADRPAATPFEGSEMSGRLTASGQRRGNGAFVAWHQIRIEAGRAVRFELESGDFDTYLLVETPSGRTVENDDIESGNLNSALEIPSTEAGLYRIGVSSYEAGATGRYAFRLGRGQTIARPDSQGGGEGGHVYGLFAGITDYPGGGNDLPECANDAIKLAEALRNAGLTSSGREVLLTDSEATLANVRSAMQRLSRQIGPDDTFIFFYSGHGNRRSGSRDPDELDGMDETLVFYDEEMVDDELGQLFDGINAQVSILALDSCYSGGFAKDVITRPNRMGLFSSEEDVLSMVASQFQAGGYLSHFLRQGVAGRADMGPRDDILTAGELTHYVYQQFAIHGRDIRLSSGYQHLVVDRGGVGPERVLWGYR